MNVKTNGRNGSELLFKLTRHGLSTLMIMNKSKMADFLVQRAKRVEAAFFTSVVGGVRGWAYIR